MTICVATIALNGCGFFGEGDNSPTVFDTKDEQQARAERRAESPGKKIHGKMYKFIDASIDGRTSSPDINSPAVLTLEEGLIKGTDGCSSFAGSGIFTPSGYEYTTRDSGPFERVDTGCEAGVTRFEAVYALEENVWRMSLEPNGILVLAEYEHGKKVFRLRPRHE